MQAPRAQFGLRLSWGQAFSLLAVTLDVQQTWSRATKTAISLDWLTKQWAKQTNNNPDAENNRAATHREPIRKEASESCYTTGTIRHFVQWPLTQTRGDRRQKSVFPGCLSGYSNSTPWSRPKFARAEAGHCVPRPELICSWGYTTQDTPFNRKFVAPSFQSTRWKNKWDSNTVQDKKLCTWGKSWDGNMFMQFCESVAFFHI